MQVCPCGSTKLFSQCCGLYLKHDHFPKTPEALMRSRYTAFYLNNSSYIQQTMCGKALTQWQAEANQASSVQWVMLKVLNASYTDDTHGQVEFCAYYKNKNRLNTLHEISQFERVNGRWYYSDGQQLPSSSIKLARNDICYCGSGIKYKHCCESK